MNKDFHWLVGLLEGEGCFGKPSPSHPTRPNITLTTSDFDIAERASKLLGVAILKKPRGDDPDHYKNIYWVRIRGGRAIALMRIIEPYMGSRRQKQIQDCLKFSKLDDPRLKDDPKRMPLFG